MKHSATHITWTAAVLAAAPAMAQQELAINSPFEAGAVGGSTAFLAIDNVSVVRTIPEPTAASLLGVGGLVFLLRRRAAA